MTLADLLLPSMALFNGNAAFQRRLVGFGQTNVISLPASGGHLPAKIQRALVLVRPSCAKRIGHQVPTREAHSVCL